MPEPELASFQVVGDYPYSELEKTYLVPDMEAFIDSDAAFLVHIGDIKAAGPCLEQRYATMRGWAELSSKPVFFVVGDNEWGCCSNPDSAKQLWDWYLGNLDELYDYPWEVRRYDRRQENWSFVHANVLFVGVSMPGGLQEPNETARIYDNAFWVMNQMEANPKMELVVFGHSGPGTESNDLFFDLVEAKVRDYGITATYIHGDIHTFLIDQPFTWDMWRVSIRRGGHEGPISIEIESPHDWNLYRGVHR